jgi:benzil reductase ((S)-benzoin forming)
MQAVIRATSGADFPEVDRFVELHEQGELRDSDEVAQDIWELLERGFENGSVVDLRDYAGST